MSGAAPSTSWSTYCVAPTEARSPCSTRIRLVFLLEPRANRTTPPLRRIALRPRSTLHGTRVAQARHHGEISAPCPYTGEVPTIRFLLVNPEERRPSPPAPRADLFRVFGAGIALFVVGLVVALILHLTGRGSIEAVAICGAGITLGGLGLLWARRNR